MNHRYTDAYGRHPDRIAAAADRFITDLAAVHAHAYHHHGTLPATTRDVDDAARLADRYPWRLRAHHCDCGRAFTRRRDHDNHQCRQYHTITELQEPTS